MSSEENTTETHIEKGQVREYMERFVEGMRSDSMVVIDVSATEVKARPVGHPGPECLTYSRSDFERWYPKVVG